MPKYSIIVPVYNAQKNLKECLDSVLRQKGDFELILIDDFSTDNSRDILSEYEKIDGVSVIYQPQNGGVSKARNTGIEKASGEYLIFIDSDDLVADDFLEIIEKNLDSTTNLLSYGDFDYVFENDVNVLTKPSNMNVKVTPSEIATESEWKDFLLKSFFASPWSKVYKTDIVKDNNLRFDEECVCFEDLIFNLNYCKYISTFRCISDPLYFYRTVKTVSHVSKRKWGTLFNISKKVARATDEFINSKNHTKDILDIRRFTYQAYLTELKSVKDTRPQDLSLALEVAIKDRELIKSIKSMKQKGKTLSLLLLATKLKLTKIATKLLAKQV